MTDLVTRACAIATRSHMAGGGFGPLLVLDGPNGSAVLRGQPTDHALWRDKARLMAVALRADSCVLVVETTLCFPGAVALQVVMLLGKDRDGSRLSLFAPRRIAGHVELRRVHSRLAAPVPADGLDMLIHDILPKSAQAGEVDRAWVCLEEMGVTIARSTRQLH